MHWSNETFYPSYYGDRDSGINDESLEEKGS